MGNRTLSVGGLLVAAVLLVAINMVAGRSLSSSRVDLTENKLFTLSDGTREILAGLDEPITLRFYLSRGLVTRLPGISSYAARVEELLEAYAREAGANVTFVEVDPEPFSEEEDRAVAYGLRGVPIDEEDATLYFGLVASGSTDQEQVIPFFSTSREQFLEYDVTRLIYSVANPKQPVVGLLSTLPINGGGPMAMLQGRGQPPWIVVEQMSELFEVMPLEPGIREVPADVGVLMLVHPKALPDETRYAIDQFVMRGGRALVFVDPNAETDPGAGPGMMGMMAPGASRSSNPKELLASWGLAMPEDEVVGDLSAAMRVRAQQEGRLVTIDYPMWMTLSGDALASSDLVTANLGAVTLASPGHLVPVEAPGLDVTPLIRTTENAAVFPRATVANLADPQAVLRDYQAKGERLVLAARVTGKAKSAFPDGPPAAPKKEGEEAAAPPPAGPHLAESSGDVNVVVVADADLLADQFWVQVQDLLGSRIAIPTSGNGPMVVNALDNLTGSSALIDIRSRGGFVRPFAVVNELRREAELRFREQEQRLMTQLDDAERKLGELESSRQGDEVAVLTDEQRQALIDFRKERLQIRKDLREVRRSLRASIERLETRLRFANVAAVPILIGVGGLLVGLTRLRRRRRSLLAAQAG